MRGIPLIALLIGLLAAPAWAADIAACDAPQPWTVLQPAREPRESRAVWLDARRIVWPDLDVGAGPVVLLHSAQATLKLVEGEPPSGADVSTPLRTLADAVPPGWRYLPAGPVFGVSGDRPASGQWVAAQLDERGRLLRWTGLQAAARLDERFAAAADVKDLGATVSRGRTRFRLWAPTAQRVSVCVYPGPDARAGRVLASRRDERTGVWTAQADGSLAGRYFSYLVDVFMPGVGLVRNRVTDPYSVSLNTDSRRSYVGDLGDAALKPAQWDATPSPDTVRASVDMTIYELHVRDFSAGDATVPPAHRGKYLAFTDRESAGMRHLRALAQAGLTDVHLLPVFDFATVPEHGCVTPAVSGPPDGEQQQAAVAAVKDRDCFNWGYDPLHYTAPEGSYASDAADGARRIVEFRAMVQALHRAGLRVGMDVVYNHTSASGLNEHSVLDRIVPGYYHRLDAQGKVERSTCCDNTATEHLMMGKLLLDSVATWAKQYRIDSFRFDLMAHQPRALMEALQRRLKAQTGRDIPLIGEGWNFGEVADGARFVQASQLSLNGSGIGSFNDRLRDAVRGGGPSGPPEALVSQQGYANGLACDPNALSKQTREDLLDAADLVRVGLAGSLRDYALRTWRGELRTLQQVDYHGQPAGYASQPSEVVNYVENHDNHTLFDNNAFKLPRGTSREDRARVQLLGAALVAFSQGVAYFHAGVDLLRSKSFDGNSYDSGDWFNRLDWSGQDNGFGAGLPPREGNEAAWGLMRPLLADAAIKPAPADIAWMRAAFRDLLRIRASTSLFHLRSAREVQARLDFPNSGAGQEPTVMVGRLRGDGLPGATFAELVVLVNVDRQPHALTLQGLQGKAFVLHPVHLRADAADRRPAEGARYDGETGAFTVPARTAVVFVRSGT